MFLLNIFFDLESFEMELIELLFHHGGIHSKFDSVRVSEIRWKFTEFQTPTDKYLVYGIPSRFHAKFELCFNLTSPLLIA